jgi:hypothetical protein
MRRSRTMRRSRGRTRRMRGGGIPPGGGFDKGPWGRGGSRRRRMRGGYGKPIGTNSPYISAREAGVTSGNTRPGH